MNTVTQLAKSVAHPSPHLTVTKYLERTSDHFSHIVAAGEFVVWDLEKRHMHHVRQAHRGPITAAVFMPKDPLLHLGWVTTGWLGNVWALL